MGITYAPSRGALALDIDIGIGLSASLQIALGPIYGQVGISLAFALNANSRNRPAKASLRLRIWGEAQILMLVSARIEIDFEASYEPGCLSASGTFNFDLEICWFLSIHISVGLTYSVGCDGSSSAQSLNSPATAFVAIAGGPPDSFDKAAEDYITLLEER